MKHPSTHESAEGQTPHGVSELLKTESEQGYENGATRGEPRTDR